MSAEPSSAPGGRTGRIECSLDNDPRLLASVETVIAHAAKLAGLPEETQQTLGAAVCEASREMARASQGANLAATPTRLIVDEFSDRLEITIDSAARGNPDGFFRQLEGKTGDRVRCDSRDGRARVTLLKPCGVAKSSAPC